MKDVKLTPLKNLSSDAIDYIHIHQTKDSLYRSTNLTSDVTCVKHDDKDFKDVPTLYYEKVDNVDTQKSDETTSSIAIYDSLKIKDEEGNDTGRGWILHALVADICRYNMEKLS